jgi:hypothetical protein
VSGGEDIHPPLDPEFSRQQVHHHHYRGGEHAHGGNGNGGWAKVRDAIVMAVVIGVGALVFTMNNRLTSMESTMSLLLQKISIQVPQQ